MTQEQKRIKLAEAAGWKVHPKDRFIVIPPNSPHSVQPLSTIPDYFNDLNAVHELEKVLTYQQHCLYCNILEMVVGGPAYMPAVRASASHRCEALGKTLNLW